MRDSPQPPVSGDPIESAGAPVGRGMAVAMSAVFALALGVRSLGLEDVFLEDGSVAFTLGDAFYHLHRARFSLLHFPSFSTFDYCLNHPMGAAVPYPPLFDLVIAGTARLFGGSMWTFERVAAWLPALLGSLAVLPVYALGRRLHGRGVGVGAAVLMALAPVAIGYSRVGYTDHHAAVVLLGALLVAGYTAVLDERVNGRPLAMRVAGLSLARLCMLLTWQGGLLYLVIGEVAIALSAALRWRRELLVAQALGLVGTAMSLIPFVALSATPVAGPWSATELSRLHVAVLLAEALILGGMLVWERSRGAGGEGARAGRLMVLAVGVAGAGLVFIPGLVEGLAPAFDFLTRRDEVGGGIPEQAPLLAAGSEYGLAIALERMGLFVFLVPVVPLVLLMRSRIAPLVDGARYLFAWSLVLGVLSMEQIRYANDFAPVASVGFALILAEAAGWVAARTGLSPVRMSAMAVVVGVLLQAPTFPAAVGSYGQSTWRWASGQLPDGDRALWTASGTQLRFAQAVREATPNVSGCDGSGSQPGYAVLSPLSIANTLHYVAQRATPASNFGPYAGLENFRRVMAFYDAESYQEAVTAAVRLRARYVITEDAGEELASAVTRRLHWQDGRAIAGERNWYSFRLVVEGPRDGVPTAALYGTTPRSRIAFKLWELVPGAVLRVPAPEGEVVNAEVEIVTPVRRFSYRASGTATQEGYAQLVVPYATGGDGPTRTASPYRVVVGDRRWEVEVSEDKVKRGSLIRLR